MRRRSMLKLEVPGIDQKDLDVRVENHTLTVKGERKFEAEEKEAELPSHRAALWQLLSRLHAAHHGRYGERRGQLQCGCAEAGAEEEAAYAQPKQIEIKVAA